MASLDLKPLTQETIEQMALEKHDLWSVKIDGELFGPFETQSLKHFSSENQHQFENAQATRMDTIDYQPFWSHTLFQRRMPQVLNSENHPGPFWLMVSGQKTGPLKFNDVDKKIETGLLGLTDHISVDDGHTWNKIFEIDGFDRRLHSSDELPGVPSESIFDKGKLTLVEKLDRPHVDAADQLASLAHVGTLEAKVIQFKVEEISQQSAQSHDASGALKWAIPSAAAVMVTIMATGYLMFSSDEKSPVVAEAETKENFYQTRPAATVQTANIPNRQINQNPRRAPRGFMPHGNNRIPASNSYSNNAAVENAHESRYPTHIETHEQARHEEPAERTAEAEFPVTENEQQQQPQEHSLVGNNNGAPEEHSLDAAMNGVNQPAEQPERPVVEEAADF
jgi:hypothetical protein